MNQALENRSGVLANKIDTHISEGEFGDLDAAAIAISASQHIASLAAAMRPNLINADDWVAGYTATTNCVGTSAEAVAKFWGITYEMRVDSDADGTTVVVKFRRLDTKGFTVDYCKPCTTTAEVAMAAVTLLGLIYSEGDQS
jgi:hypothetical protein